MLLDNKEIIGYTVDGDDCCHKCATENIKEGSTVCPLTREDIENGQTLTCDGCSQLIARK